MTHILACYDLLFEATVDDKDMARLLDKSQLLVTKLRNTDNNAPNVFAEISSYFDDDFHMTVHDNRGEMATFLLNYMKQVQCLMRFITGSRQGDWLLHLAALEEQTKYYFAHDLYKYARMVPVYLAQMFELETSDPHTWNALQVGDFAVKKSGIPFTDLFVDQTLEQKIRELKVIGGITGITQDEEELNRFFLIAPELTRIVNSFQEVYGIDSKPTGEKQHYQLSTSMSLRIHENAAKITASIREHCGGNPFAESIDLLNVVSSRVVPAEAKDDILRRDKKGDELFRTFVSERMVTDSADKSIWDPVKKAKLKTFSSYQKKPKYKIGDKLVKLREDRQLLARFLVIQQSRPTLVSSLGDTIAKYEFSVIPRSLFSSDGLLLIPTDKSSFHHVIEHYPSENKVSTADQTVFSGQETVEGEPMSQCVVETYTDPSATPCNDKVCIIDAMAVVQSIKKGPNMCTCSDFAAAFLQRITMILKPYTEGRVIFDRYVEGSLKTQTRQKRAGVKDPVKFKINDATNIKMVPLKTLLSHTETKAQLTEYLGKALLSEFADNDKNLVVVYDTTAHCNKADIIEPDIAHHSHEEADTLIPLHVIDAAIHGGGKREIDVLSPDTDVLVLLMDMYSRAGATYQLNLITGRGKDGRVIDVTERCLAIGKKKCQGLLGLHNFSGADWGGKFVGISKKRWIMSYLTHDPNSDVIAAFTNFGDESLNLSSPRDVLEGFVCSVYSKTTKCQKIDDLRWELFRSKNLEGEKLPPTVGALTPHLQRANYGTRIGRSYKPATPTIPSILDHGWERSVDGDIIPVKSLELPAPEAVLELIKCGCRTQCSRNCSCVKNELLCTALCKCSDCENTVDYSISDVQDSHED